MSDPLVSATQALVWATAVLAAVGIVQLVVNCLLWRANSAQADLTKHQLLSANRPRVRIDWRLTPPERQAQDNYNLVGELREFLGRPVILHWAKTRVNPDGQGYTSNMPAESAAQCELDGDHIAIVVDTPVRLYQHIDVEVTVSVSTANVPGTNETCSLESSIYINNLDDQYRTIDSYADIVWKTKKTLAADVHTDHPNATATALTRAWRGGR